MTRIEELVAEGMSLPALPAIGAELMEAIALPADEIDIRRLGHLLENDPSTTARLLRLANSPIYGCKTRTTSVAHAITKLGLNETLEFLNFYFVRKTMPEFPATKHFDNEYFWRNSWAAAHIARTLCNPRYLVRALPGELYLAGLLHGLGMALMAVHMPDEFETALTMNAEQGVSLAEAEHQVIGVNHASLSAHLLTEWRAPERIAGAVRFHLEPVYAPNEFIQEAAGLVQYATLMAGAWRPGDPANPNDPGEIDLACLEQSWIVERRRGPLADPAVQTSLKAEVLAQLKAKKALLLGEAESGEPEENGGPATAPAAHPAHAAQSPVASHSRPEPKKSFWARLKEKLGF